MKNSTNQYNSRKAIGKTGDKSARLNNRKILENAQKKKKEGQVRADATQPVPSGSFFLERSRSHNNIGEQIDLPGHLNMEMTHDHNTLININTNTSGSMVMAGPPPVATPPFIRDRLFPPPNLDLPSHASNQQSH